MRPSSQKPRWRKLSLDLNKRGKVGPRSRWANRWSGRASRDWKIGLRRLLRSVQMRGFP